MAQLAYSFDWLVQKHVITPSTFHDICEVFAWCFKHLIAGVHPSARHDNKEWLPSDKQRNNKAGQPLGFQALLCEVRGDWKFYKECFNFPGWNTVSGICWHCDCTPAELREVGPDAGWRNRRLSHWDLIHRIRRNNVEVSPLCSSPFLKGSCFKIDWLHAVDQGVGADFLGNFLLSGSSWRAQI